MTGKYEQALDGQVELMNWWQSAWANRYAQGFFTSMGVDEATAMHESVREFGSHESTMLQDAPTYWVSSAMGELTEVAARSMPPQPLQEGDLPAPTGFVFMESTVRGPDVRGNVVGFKAFSWKPLVVYENPDMKEFKFDGVWVTFYSDREDAHDAEWRSGLAEQGIDYRKVAASLVMVHCTYWKWGQPWGNEIEEFDSGKIMDFRRYVAAWWTLIQQTLTYKSVAVPSRPWRRRAERAGVTSKNVVVVTLRKYKEHDRDPEAGEAVHDEEEERKWSHQWLVDGHWRNQACGPGMKDHRLIWISPYIKGPEDGPLVLKDRVYKWVR